MNENIHDDANQPKDILDELSMGSKRIAKANAEADKKKKESVLGAINIAKNAGFTKGKKVKHIYDNEVGEIVGYNRKENGYYSGDKCPIVVKFKRGKCKYGIESLEIVN